MLPERRCNAQPSAAAAPARDGGGKRLGYSLPDIFHLEVCLFHQICTNGRRLFELRVGEPFTCAFSHERYAALVELLLGAAREQAPAGCTR